MDASGSAIAIGRDRPHSPWVSPTHPPRRLFIVLALVVFPLVLDGCSGFMQTIGARWVTRKLASEFDLDDSQKKATRAAVDRLLDAAPGVLGPPMQEIVASLDRAIAQGLTEETLLALEAQFNPLADEVALRVIDEAAPLLATLRDPQIDHAERRIRERFNEAREDLDEPGEERLEQRQDQYIEAIEKWTGNLSKIQEADLRAQVTKYPDETAMRLDADERRLEGIGETIRAHEGAPAIRDAMWKAWQNRGDWGPEARPAEVRRADNRRALLYIDSLLDRRQRENAREHLRSLHRRLNRFLAVDD